MEIASGPLARRQRRRGAGLCDFSVHGHDKVVAVRLTQRYELEPPEGCPQRPLQAEGSTLPVSNPPGSVVYLLKAEADALVGAGWATFF
jgi:hypothetical protein